MARARWQLDQVSLFTDEENEPQRRGFAQSHTDRSELAPCSVKAQSPALPKSPSLRISITLPYDFLCIIMFVKCSAQLLARHKRVSRHHLFIFRLNIYKESQECPI